MAAVTICSDFGAPKNKVCHCFTVSPSICHEVMGTDAMIYVFWMLSFKPASSLSSLIFYKRLFSSSLSALKGCIICISGEGNGNPRQCSCLENPRDRGARWAAIYGVSQSRTRLKWLSISSSKEPLYEDQSGVKKNWLKTQHSKNEAHGIWFHHFMANRRVKSRSCDRFSILGLQNYSFSWL